MARSSKPALNRLWISLACGLWGGTTMLALAPLRGLDVGLTLQAALGAAVAGATLAPLLARRHRGVAVAAILLTTTLGASVAGGFAGFPQDIALGLIVGPVAVWAGLLSSPLALIVWLIGAVVTRRVAYSLK